MLDKDGGSDPRTNFYNKFKEEVAEHDDELQEKHDEDLNTTLIFVSPSTLRINMADPWGSPDFFPP